MIEFRKDNTVRTERPYNPKKITGDKIGAVLGLNPYESPFAAWAGIAVPYRNIKHKDTPERKAGRILEPKIADYWRANFGGYILSPEEATGAVMPEGRRIDLFPQNHFFGGRWDYIGDFYIMEIKTGHKPVTDFPAGWIAQAGLYAWLCGFSCVEIAYTIVPPDALPIQSGDEFDTTPTDNFKITAQNTTVKFFNINTYFGGSFYDACIRPAEKFWNDYIATGVSPVYDINKDAKTLRMLSDDRNIL